MIDQAYRERLREALVQASRVAQQTVSGCDEFDAFTQVFEAARTQLNDPILPGKPGEPDVERVTARVVDLLVSHGKVLSPIGTRPATVADLIQALRVADPDTLIVEKVNGEWELPPEMETRLCSHFPSMATVMRSWLDALLAQQTGDTK